MTDQYTDQEIVELYRRGRRDPRIIAKLCDLALMPEDNVLSILHCAGYALTINKKVKHTRRKKISDQVWREIIALKLRGMDIENISRLTGICQSSISKWRNEARKRGISLPEGPIQSRMVMENTSTIEHH